MSRSRYWELSVKTPEEDSPQKTEERLAKCIVASEILFMLAPILILFFFRGVAGQLHGALRWPEWSYTSIILFGSSIVKLASGISKASGRQRWQFTTLLFAFLVLFGLTPPALMLGIIYLSASIPKAIIVLQLVWFVLAVAAYWNIAATGQILLDRVFGNEPK